MQQFMTRLGSDIVNRARANIVNQRIVDTGRLLNSISFRMEANGETMTLYAGAFGVRHAALHEFGMRYTPAMMRAMFASLHNRGLLGKRPGKGLLVGGVMPPRPYLRPAFAAATANLTERMQSFLQGGDYQ
jgi:phage gpG-like protein